jgi:branched-chain amino acid transport system substrate-binding protein
MNRKKFSSHRRSMLLAGSNLLLLGAANVHAKEIKPLKIGVLTDMSGLYQDITGRGSVTAAKMAVEDYIAQGGKQTRPIEIISGDHQNKADVGSAIARRWIDREGVDVIADVPTSSVALAVNQIVKQKNKVMLASGPSSSDLTGKDCSPNTVQWTWSTYALAVGAAMITKPDETWFTMTVDYAFGHAMLRDLKAAVTKNGGKVIGNVLTPLGTPDFSSFLLQAQSSKAQVIAFINAGGDTINSVKQAAEFGLTRSGRQRLVATVLYIDDIHSLGLEVAQGLQFTNAFYWDLNPKTRAWSKRFAKRMKGRYPSCLQAGVYSSILHYLQAEAAVGESSNGKVVVDKMKALPIDDALFGKGSIRIDGRTIHDMYLFEVKKPSESHHPWDYCHVVKTLPASEVWRPLDAGGCYFVKKT